MSSNQQDNSNKNSCSTINEVVLQNNSPNVLQNHKRERAKDNEFNLGAPESKNIKCQQGNFQSGLMQQEKCDDAAPLVSQNSKEVVKHVIIIVDSTTGKNERLTEQQVQQMENCA